MSDVTQALEDFAKLRLKARFVFRSINPSQGAFSFPGGGTFGGAGIFVFPMNPQHFEVHRPTLGAVYRTAGGRYEEDWGMGVERLQIRGTFGFRARNQLGSGGLPLVGMDQLLLLQDMIVGYYNTARALKTEGSATWEFYDLADMYFLQIRIDAFSMRRVVNEPYLHFYSISASVLEDYFSAGSTIPRIPFSQIPGLPAAGGTAIAVIMGAIGALL